MNSEIDDLLLDCYISSVINNARKDTHKIGMKKVRFGGVFIKEYTLEHIDVDDTLPVDDVDEYCIHIDSLGIDQNSSEVDDMNGNTYFESSFSEEELFLKKHDNEITKLNSYDDFLSGVRKRLYVNIFKNSESVLNSPERKKTRAGEENVEYYDIEMSDDTFRCSTPEDDHVELSDEQIEDILMFLEYHVYSYAIKEHLSILIIQKSNINNNIETAQTLTTPLQHDNHEPENLYLLRNKATCHKRSNNNTAYTVGLLLAKQILHKNMQDEESQIIRNENTENSFLDDEQSYNNFIREHERSRFGNPIQLNQSRCTDDECVVTQGRDNRMSLQDLDMYLMPETDEPLFEGLDILTEVNSLQRENISNIYISHKKLEELTEHHNNTVSEFEDEQLRLADSPLFGKQSDCNNDCPLTLSPFENNKVSMGNEINDMMCELMASQAVHPVTNRSTRTDNSFNKFMKRIHESNNTPELSEDSVVPGHKFDQQYMMIDEHSIFKETENEKSNRRQVKHRMNILQHNIGHEREAGEKEYLNDQIVPSNINKDVDLPKPSFQWNRPDDSVVPFSHELFINSPSKIQTPQKLRLGLSKRNKVKGTLHPYKKI